MGTRDGEKRAGALPGVVGWSETPCPQGKTRVRVFNPSAFSSFSVIPISGGDNARHGATLLCSARHFGKGLISAERLKAPAGLSPQAMDRGEC
jgi:hypothetical protein